MEKDRKIKVISICALLLAICGMSLGFAAFSTSLNLASSAVVTPDSATFSVKFSTSQDELVVGEVVPSDITSGLVATNGVIDNSASPTLKNLSVTFTYPGQYVEYTFYARNEGEYTAYLNSVNFFGEKTCEAGSDATASLADAACDSINMSVYVDDTEYSETTPITGHALEKGAGEKIKVRISYDVDGTAIDGTFNITFGDIIMVYSTINDSTYIPSDSILNATLLTDYVKSGAVVDSSIDFGTTPTTGTYIVSGTEGNTNPIYYYRGAVTNNNVLFANFCWKIVRTTDTGGTKLIYNGVPAADGSCNNTGTASQLSSTSAFNSSYNSPAYVGYMYGTVYTATSKSLTDQSETYLYGNNFTWDGTNYSLNEIENNTTTSSDWSTDRTTLATKYHYTCFDSDGVCESIYYINYFGNSSTAYYITLTGGKSIEDAKNEMFTNTTDSKIKTAIDSWYASNMTSYTDQLEDTVWCNDRSLYSGSLKSKDTDAGTGDSYFEAYGRNVSTTVPLLSCSSTRDSFTVNSSNGNGKLTYPVGLLTADEYTLAGSGNKGYSTSSYLYTGQYQWSLSPYYFFTADAYEFFVYSRLSSNVVSYTGGVRPSVSLEPGTLISSGDGSVSTPYIVY